MDGALDAVYGDRGRAGWAGRAPTVARWLGELRAHFPCGVVRVVQQDAIDRLGLHRLLLEPEVLENVTPDVHLAATLMSLRDALPEASRTVARSVVRQVVRGHRAAARRPHARARRAARWTAARGRAGRGTPRSTGTARSAPTSSHYQPEHRTVDPGAARRPRAAGGARSPRELILVPRPEREHGRVGRPRRACSAPSLASLPDAADTKVIAFDTRGRRPHRRARRPGRACCSASSSAAAPTSTRRSATARRSSRHPAKTVLILVTDLYEGGDAESMLRRAASLLRSGVRLIVLLALSDDGAPGYDARATPRAFAALGAPVFACTPDQFPEMLAAALEGRDVGAWAGEHDIAVV